MLIDDINKLTVKYVDIKVLFEFNKALFSIFNGNI